jgi:hypothetical protein
MQKFAVITTKSFGDFVIAHAALNSVEAGARDRVRLIACSHVRDLGAILPDDVRVTFLALRDERVPALFDIRKRGIPRALESALWLRRALGRLPREPGETLAFEGLGMRERLIAAHWPVVAMRRTGNIYETYARFLTDLRIPNREVQVPRSKGPVRTVGIFPESRLAAKALNSVTVSIIVEEAARAGLEPRLFVLDGDLAATPASVEVIRVPRNFQSLAQAIVSVDCVVSADSLPGHLGEYLAKPVFVAAAYENEYWLPGGCYLDGRWGLFSDVEAFRMSLGTFLAESAAIRAT